MISCQPSLGHVVLKVLPDVILVASHDPRSALRHVDLQDAQSRRVSRRMSHGEARCDLVVFTVKRLPVDIEGQVLRHVDARVGFGCYRIERVLDLELVDVDRDASISEMLESTGMVKMEMTNDDHLDVFDRVPSEGNLRVKVHGMVVVYACEDVVDLGSYDFWIVRSRAGFEEYESFGWVLDEEREHDKSSTNIHGIFVGEQGCISLSIS